MTGSPAQRRRGLAARLTAWLVVLGALPLMAPTCGTSGEGFKIFSRRSLIIPMDVCYQYQTDGVRTSYAPAAGAGCPNPDPGDVIKAYGLVYQLIRNGIAVYWVIDNAKTAVTGIDLTVEYAGGFPVFLFDWAAGVEGAPPATPTGHAIDYRGGPFVVDGSDYARAVAILQSFRTTFGNVNVHVSNVAFRGYAKRTMAGGWSAGGAVPPKLALLDIGSSGAGSKNSEVVIQGYLTRAGLDTPGAAGTTSPGAHGEIFDRLFMPDFVPTTGTWTNTNLAKNKYQILWVPHWAAPSSCSDCPPSTSCTCANKYPAATITSALNTIGSFVTQVNPLTGTRGDMFAECAGLGSFEGVFSGTDPSATGVNSVYGTGVASTHYQTENTTGVWINKNVGSAKYWGNYSSPLMQIGDYPFIPRTGAIQNFKAAQYKAETVRLISEDTSVNDAYDIFTLVPATPDQGAPGAHGSIVYLGGHSYSGTDGAFEVAGARLVLNTLFNLGSTCTATGVPCATGLPGVCSAGRYVCQGDQAVCVADVQPGQRAEICNGLDDDCDGQVDENLQSDCYEPPPGYVDPLGRSGSAFQTSKNFGVCRPGIQVCQRNPDGSYAMSACAGQVLPAAETCNGLDDDCNSTIDDGIAPVACYDGPPSTANIGECRNGTQVCQGGSFGAPAGAGFIPGACAGEVLPKAEICGDSGAPGGAKDDDCDGRVNNGCTCTPGVTPDQTCFSGPGTVGQGICQAGLQTCGEGGNWSACNGEVVANLVDPEPCISVGAPYEALKDWNCDGQNARCLECTPGQSRSCYGTGGTPPAYAGVGQCTYGTQTCTAAAKWGSCSGYVLPSVDAQGQPIEYCDGKDNDCDGPVDDNAICPAGRSCVRGVCVPSSCGTERPAPEGYACTSGTVVPAACGDFVSPGCAVGAVCQFGTCIDPCPVDSATGESKVCGGGTVCGGGACIGGSCYEAGCAAGQVCRAGSCATDPCAGRLCPSGTFCREGDCVQACTFVTCAVGQKCGIDGFCEADPCAGRTCGPGQRCSAGVCAADPCLGKGCAEGQVCSAIGGEAVCVDDPCNGITCPAGACAGGQCFSAGNLTGAGSAPAKAASEGGCGCGSGTGVALPALLALLAAPFARRRRPPGGRGGHGGLLLLVAVVALTASACKDTKTEFDPSKCTATCGEQRCVDVNTDPGHCGDCALSCGGGEQCAAGTCGPASAVAPYLRSLTPSTGPKDNPSVTVTLSGERFQPNAQVRLTTPAGPRTLSCPSTAGGACRWVSAGSMVVTLDLTGSTTEAWKLRVVNPDNVISNAVSFGVVVPTPAIAGVVPSTVAAGTTTVLEVSPTGAPGTGFTSGSTCHLTGPVIGEQVLGSTLSGSQLDCVLAGAGIPPGSYTLQVVSETGVRSNGVTITVAPSDPVVYAVDPSSTPTSSPFSITGARFDPRTAAVLFFPLGTDIDVATPLDPAFVRTFDSGLITVRGYPQPANGQYTVAVRNGAGAPFKYSNGVAFTVGGSAPTITSFTPATAYQGDPAVTLTFTGTAFPSDATIEVEPPGSTVFSPLASATSCPGSCTTSATKSFIKDAAAGIPEPEGSWLVRLRFGATPSSPTSAPWPLRVLSNQAILRDYTASPDPQQAGTVGGKKDSLVFQVSNIRGPAFSSVKVWLEGPVDATAKTVRILDPNPDPNASSTVLNVPGPNALSLVGLDVGTYAFTVRNPNATPSNALPFAVTPGRPTLQSVSPASAHQQNAPVTVRLTGTNFAKPDANGNGSTVVVAADFMTDLGFPTPDPCNATTGGTQFQPVPGTITVVSATAIDVQLDTRAAFVDPDFGTTYYVGVWNPPTSGASVPQKSSCGVDPRTLPSFKLLP